LDKLYFAWEDYAKKLKTQEMGADEGGKFLALKLEGGGGEDM
jgi:hypothetical protein